MTDNLTPENQEVFEGIIVARANTIEQIAEPFTRGKDTPLVATLTINSFDEEQLANILPSTGASFLMVDFHAEGITRAVVERLIGTEQK